MEDYESSSDEDSDLMLSNHRDFCRICRMGNSTSQPLLSLCACNGSIRFIHRECLQQWLAHRHSSDPGNPCCEICKCPYRVQWRRKPLLSWKKPNLSDEDFLTLNIFAVSYVLASVDIGYTFRCVLYPLLMESKPFGLAFILRMCLTLLTLGSWVYIFSLHARFVVHVCRKWRNQNVELVVEKDD
eukprot:TRINITY_DN9901_c0_g1_i1.p1 TRINITY_DN9901_c0_g1~~TRINITY_DN9901_c0_g1_i1.p1  ORF type:complete len:185 (-),score=3.61 TRINITY_DN9901_c0_g1_i1:155-709(-)